MGTLADMERTAWKLSPFGSKHPNFQPPQWRLGEKGSAELPPITWTTPYDGDPKLSGLWRRNWPMAVVMEVDVEAFDNLLNRPGSVPAVGFKLGSRLGVGALPHEAVGRVEDGVENRYGHGMRLGPDENTQFCIGALLASGKFESVPQGALHTSDEVVPVGTFGNPASAYRNVNFS
jgi:hypothetical protein